MTPTQEYIQKAKEEFREKFINDHNKGEERFLRGLFIEEFESFLEQKLRGIREETLKEVIALKKLRVPYKGLERGRLDFSEIESLLSSQETAKEEDE